MDPQVDDSIESDWAIVRPNRRSAEEIAKVEQEGRGFAWVGFVSHKRSVGTRIMIQIPAPMKVIIEETEREQEVQVFQINYGPDEPHEVDAIHLYLSEVGNEPVARLTLNRRRVSPHNPLNLGFRITGFGYLNACWLTNTDDPIPTLSHEGDVGGVVPREPRYGRPRMIDMCQDCCELLPCSCGNYCPTCVAPVKKNDDGTYTCTKCGKSLVVRRVQA